MLCAAGAGVLAGLVGAGVGAGPADSEALLEPPLPPSTAATMKTIATTTSAAIRLQRPGDRLAALALGLRGRRCLWRRRRRVSAAGLAAAGFLSGAGSGVAAAFATF